MHSSCSISEGMEYLKIDPVLIITHPEKKRFFVRDIKAAAGCTCLCFHHCRNITPLQIEPEQSLTEDSTEKRIFFHCPVQCRLQSFFFYFFFQFTVKTKYSCIILSCHSRERQCCIIQFSPLSVLVFHVTLLLPVKHLVSIIRDCALFFHFLSVYCFS